MTVSEAAIIEATVIEATVIEATVIEATVIEATVIEATVIEATVIEATVIEATVIEATVIEATVIEAPVLGSLAERAYAELRDRLVTLALVPGEPINEEALARELGVGRTPVREALKRLEQDRLVITYPRRGTFATRVEITDLAFISELRAELEPLAAARAARVASPAARAHLRTVIAELPRVVPAETDVIDLLQADAAIHRAIYTAAANPYLQDTLVRLNNLATRIWVLVMDRLDGVAGHLHEHADLVTAIVDGDADRAAALSRAHVNHFEQVVRRALFAD